MYRNKLLLVFQSMLLFLGSVPVCNAYFSTALVEMGLRSSINSADPLTLGGQLFEMFLNEGGMRTLNFSPSRNFLDSDHIDSFETCVHESIVRRMIVGSKEISLKKTEAFNYYGTHAIVAVLASICVYGGYRFYKNLKIKKKGTV